MDPRDVLGRPAESPDAVLRYADHEDGVIDVFLPPSLGRPTAPFPLLMLVHGGFWRQEFDRRHLRPLANAIAARGRVVTVPEFRRVGGLGGWPQTPYDVRDALAAVPFLVAAAAPGWTDHAAPITLAGHSAGGHLGLWSGLQGEVLRVDRIVALAPVSDLRLAAELRLDSGAAQDLLGGEPADVPHRYAAADPRPHVDGRVSVTVIHGTEDEQVPVAMSRAFAAGLESTPAFDYVELPGVEHFGLIDPMSVAFETAVWPALTRAAQRPAP